MRMGEHRKALVPSTAAADRVFWYQPPGMDWSLDDVLRDDQSRSQLAGDLEELIAQVVAQAEPGDDVVIMSNGGFGGIHQRLLDALTLNHQE